MQPLILMRRHTAPALLRANRQRARAHFTNRSNPRGLLIAMEGPDGSGKTTQRKLFKTWLQAEGHDVVTNVDDPVESYQRFIARVIKEYESLALIFNFVTVDAEQSIVEQHHQLRRLFREGEKRPWSAWNIDAVAEWLSLKNGDRG